MDTFGTMDQKTIRLADVEFLKLCSAHYYQLGLWRYLIGTGVSLILIALGNRKDKTPHNFLAKS
jgi:hypothetical protein